jgi:hypothetical protein
MAADGHEGRFLPLCPTPGFRCLLGNSICSPWLRWNGSYRQQRLGSMKAEDSFTLWDATTA